MKKEIKNQVMLTLLYFYSLLNRFKVSLGLIKVKYNIINYFEYQGWHFSRMFHVEDRVKACETYDNFRSDDVVLLTYPKTGTHFTAGVIASIFKEKGLIKGDNENMSAVSILEAKPPSFMHHNASGKGDHPLSNIDAAPSPRIIGTHMPWNLLPVRVREGKVKVIHCYRNPKDVLCSYYPFVNKGKFMAPGNTWKEFVENFINGTVLYGSFLTWLKQWYPHRNNSTMLNLQFEDLKQDLEGNVQRIAEFLGIELTQEQVDRVVTTNTFENKKKAAGTNHIVYRKGKSGGWKSDITVEQNEILDQWIHDEMEEMPDLKFQCI